MLIAYDRDDAGEKAAEALATTLMTDGIDCYRVLFPKGMDANEYALKVTPATKALGLVLRKALWLGKGAAPQRVVDGVCAPAPTVLHDPLHTTTTDTTTTDTTTDTAAVILPLAAEWATSAPLPASPVPSAPPADMPVSVTDTEVVIPLGGRRYRVRGLAKNASHEVLKVNVLVSCSDALYVDTLDLYAARQRAAYVSAVAIELQVSEDIIKHDLGQVLLKCEALQEARLQTALAPKPIAAVTMSEAEREAALALLRDPQLLDRIVADLDACGLVGETTNKLVAYLAAVSRRVSMRRSPSWCNRARRRARPR